VVPPVDLLDPDALEAVRTAALGEAERLGATHAEIRVERIRSQMVRLRDATLETAADDDEVGIGLRVVHDGSIGFAATVAPGPDAAAGLAGLAVDAARAAGLARRVPLELADEPSHGRVDWSSGYQVDPVTVPLAARSTFWGAGAAAYSTRAASTT
jgi:TldD protein